MGSRKGEQLQCFTVIVSSDPLRNRKTYGTIAGKASSDARRRCVELVAECRRAHPLEGELGADHVVCP